MNAVLYTQLSALMEELRELEVLERGRLFEAGLPDFGVRFRAEPDSPPVQQCRKAMAITSELSRRLKTVNRVAVENW